MVGLVVAPLALAGAEAGSAAPPGLVAAYSFDEGSGTAATDSSGNGRTGAIVGASWASGRYGSGLDFDGVNDRVDLPALGTFYDAGFTLEAWVKKRTAAGDAAVVGSWSGADEGGPMLWVDHLAGRHYVTLNRGFANYLDSGRSPLVGQWQHLAATFDGSTARYFVDAVQVASRSFSGNVGDSNVWRIGAYGPGPAGFFDGVIDDVRIYNRALSQSEVQADMAGGGGPPDTTPPSTPGSFTQGATTGTSVATSWTASTDNVGVVGYRLFRNGAQVDSTGSTSFTFTGLTCETGYTLGVEAYDAAGNVSGRATLNATTGSCGPPPPPPPSGGLVAFYRFDEGAGTSAGDSSGNGHAGAIAGASWAAGRYGSGLSFDGTNDRVDLPGLGTFYDGGFTYEAWVKKQGTKTDVAVLGSWDAGSDGGPMLWVDHLAGRHYVTLNRGFSNYLDSGRSPAVGQWQHLAATFDGGTARYFVDGVQVASRSFSGNVGDSNVWRIGAYGPGPAGFFDGVIDEVRVYSRALSAAEIQSDMGAGSSPPDTTPPSTPGSFTQGATTGTSVATSWTASTDNVGVAGYRLFRNGAQVDSTGATSFTFTGLACETGYTLGVEAYDAAGNVSGRATLNATTGSCGPPPPPPPPPSGGLVAAYGFHEGAGSVASDGSGNGKAGAIVGASWAAGRYGSGLSFDGTNDRVDLPGLGTFYDGGFTYEAWVKKQGTKTDVAVMGSWDGGAAGGPMLWVSHQTGNHTLTLSTGASNYLNSGRAPAVGQWQHLAVTFNGSTARYYVDGVEAASRPFSGNVGDSNTWRIGAYGPGPAGFFDGVIDEVRVYDYALSAAQVQSDMSSPVPGDTTAPQITSVQPADGATGVQLGASVKAVFDEGMDPATFTATTFQLRKPGGNPLPANVTYDAATRTASLAPASALEFGTTYTATVKGGAGGVKDVSGNPLAADRTWSFTSQSSASPVLLVESGARPFSKYVGEILRAEGLNGFTSVDVAVLAPSLLSSFDVVVLGETPLTPADVSTLSDWVAGGGNLVALRPDKQLAGLLGIVDSGTTLSNAYLRINTAAEAGAGLVGETVQFHGTADRYALSGATAVATLYSNASSATSSPAVTLRSVGTSGGQAAAFTYDLARSVVLTRQGNPAWVGQDRDGIVPARPNDLFYGAASGDPQPDWVDTAKLQIPQADEQQRLLANLIVTMTRDRKPIPRFWYLPRGEKAAIVMTGDDHAEGGTAPRFDKYKAQSPAGCSVADWECVRATSYVYPWSPLTNAQAAGYVADGFEVADHVRVGGGCGSWTPAELDAAYDEQLGQFAAKYTSVPAPASERTHCVAWSDWATQPKVELDHGIRLDTNYYHYPAAWIGSLPGFMTGSGLVMRFADLNGTPIDVYQAHTHMTDEAGQAYPATANALLDRALGPEGYYGVFTTNMHTDRAVHEGSDAIVASALARSVPVVSARQMLDWLNGRDGSSFKNMSWNGNAFGFTIESATGANGLQAMLPSAAGGKTLASITRGGTPVFYTTQTIKGIQYAVFPALAGSYAATYAP